MEEGRISIPFTEPPDVGLLSHPRLLLTMEVNKLPSVVCFSLNQSRTSWMLRERYLDGSQSFSTNLDSLRNNPKHLFRPFEKVCPDGSKLPRELKGGIALDLESPVVLNQWQEV